MLKKYWYIIMLLVVTLGLGVVTFLTSQRLAQTEPVAPTVPQRQPRAVSESCTLTFFVEIPITGEPTFPAEPTPTEEPTPTGTIQPSPTSTRTPTPTNTPLPTATGVPASTNTPINTPTDVPEDEPTPTDAIATLPPGVSATPAPTDIPPVGCDNVCVVTTDCASDLTCIDGACRNPSCAEEVDCVCNIAQAAAPTSVSQTPSVPVSGNMSWLGYMVLIAGFAVLVLGLAL